MPMQAGDSSMHARHANMCALIAAAAFLAVAPFSSPRNAGAQTIAITGGRVFPVNGAPIDNGTVVIRDGKIVAVGANVAVPPNAQRIDASGRWVTPGFFDAASVLTLQEIAQVADTRDFRARGRDAVAASFRPWLGLDPTSQYVVPSRNEGVTNVAIVPQGNLVSGQVAVLDLVDGSASDMLRRAPVAMLAEVGDVGAANAGARGELLDRLREVLLDARTYATRRAEYERAQTRPFAASRADLEALVPVTQGRLPLMVAADKASDIQTALDIAAELKLRLIILGGAEAWRVANRLAAQKVPVLVGAMNNIPLTFSTLGSTQENAALLARAGVPVALFGNAGGGDEEAFNVRNIRFEAGNAVAYGMTWNDALRAVTLTPAEIFGVADRIGTLEAGRDANVVIWSADPFEFATRAEHVFVRGVERRELSRQDLLMRRYRTMPPQYRQP
jgi:imidazolonepropionase-like amidohydrolase